MKPDARALKCLCRLTEGGFESFFEWLEGERHGLLGQLVKCRDESQIHRLQGKAELLDDLLITIRDARQTLHKLER